MAIHAAAPRPAAASRASAALAASAAACMCMCALLGASLHPHSSSSNVAWPSLTGVDALLLPQPVDHFNASDTRTWNASYYLGNTTGFKANTGPIFFYVGPESPTGEWAVLPHVFEMTTWAAKTHGLVVAAEHRYFGVSLPFGNASFSDANLRFLTVEQTLADYVATIEHVKAELDAPKSPVITVGGSYGGFLSAAMRVHYPDIVNASLASAAPVYQYGDVDNSTWYDLVSETIRDQSADCANQVQSEFEVLWAGAYPGGGNATTRAALQSALMLCQPVATTSDVATLTLWAKHAFSIVTQFNYPRDGAPPTGVAYPLAQVCNASAWAGAGAGAVDGVGAGVAGALSLPTIRLATALTYNSSTAPLKCFSYKSSSTADDAGGAGDEAEGSRLRGRLLRERAHRAAAAPESGAEDDADVAALSPAKAAAATPSELATSVAFQNQLAARVASVVGPHSRAHEAHSGSGLSTSAASVVSDPLPIQRVPWLYLCCTEIVMPVAGTGIFSMPHPYSLGKTEAFCASQYGATVDPTWHEAYMVTPLANATAAGTPAVGRGAAVAAAQAAQAGSAGGVAGGVRRPSNIVFTNGGFDPVRGFAPASNLSATVVALNGVFGHTFDLFATAAADPANVVQTRADTLALLRSWLHF